MDGEGQKARSRKPSVRCDLSSSFDASSHARSGFRPSQPLPRIPASRSTLQSPKHPTYHFARGKNRNGFRPKRKFCNARVTCLWGIPISIRSAVLHAQSCVAPDLSLAKGPFPLKVRRCGTAPVGSAVLRWLDSRFLRLKSAAPSRRSLSSVRVTNDANWRERALRRERERERERERD